MEQYERELLISRITTGYLRHSFTPNLVLYVKSPSQSILYDAQSLYIDTYYDGLDNELLSDEEVFQFLCQQGLWDKTRQNQLDKILPDHIEYWKVKLYEAALKANERQRIRKYLEVARQELN